MFSLFLISRFVLYALLLLPLSGYSQISHKLPKSLFHKLDRKAEQAIPSLASFLVWQHDSIIHENYFHGATRDTALEIMSVTKSILSALAGIAEQKGLLPNLDTSVISILPEYGVPRTKDSSDTELWEADRCRARLTLRHLLTMQAGFNASDNDDYSYEAYFSSDPVRFTLELSYPEDPGDTFNYSSLAAHVFGAALARVVKSDLKTFADSTLFAQLPMNVATWDRDIKGRNLGGIGIRTTARDLLNFGVLYLHNGRTGNTQILPEAWIKESLSKQAELTYRDVMPGVNGYGYYWWRRKSHGHQLYCATGFGGQLICIIPDLDMVIVNTCLLNKRNRGRSELLHLHKMVDELLANVP